MTASTGEPAAPAPAPPDLAPASPAYRRRLLVLLSLATFFEGYDFLVINLVLPLVQKDFGVSTEVLGLGVSAVAAGTLVAFFVVRAGDRWGRRPVLQATVFCYALFTALTAFSQGLLDFVAWQFLARIFLVGEWGLATVMVAEEFPEGSRGTAIAIVQSMGALGGIMAAALFPLVRSADFGWRGMYLVGLLPILLVGFLRRRLRETPRWLRTRHLRGGQGPSFWAAWRLPHGRLTAWMSLVWILVYAPYVAFQTFWTLHVMNDRGWSAQMVSTAMAVAYLLGISGFYVAGKLMDWLGRRRTAALFYVCGTAAVLYGFQARSTLGISLGLLLQTFFVGAFLPVTWAFTTELFPTELRANAAAWSNNLLGRLGMIGAPALVGYLTAPLGNVGNAVSVIGLLALAAAAIVLAVLPETRWRAMADVTGEAQE